MNEARLESWYKPGKMIESSTWARNWEMLNYEKFKNAKIIGVLIEDRCPQCGARTWLNANGNQWCWNCNWDGFLYYFDNIQLKKGE